MREVAAAIRRARDLGKPIIWGIGGHVIKTGLSPVLIDLMDRGFVTAFASNGSVQVHDQGDNGKSIARLEVLYQNMARDLHELRSYMLGGRAPPITLRHPTRSPYDFDGREWVTDQ
jgi:cob(I)alamin adenosyltransferase